VSNVRTEEARKGKGPARDASIPPWGPFMAFADAVGRTVPATGYMEAAAATQGRSTGRHSGSCFVHRYRRFAGEGSRNLSGATAVAVVALAIKPTDK
jgi:hypothetical protein